MTKQKFHLKIEKIEKYISKTGCLCMRVNGKYLTPYNGEKIGEEYDYIVHHNNIICLCSNKDKVYM